MKLQKREIVTLAVVLSFFAILIIFAIFIRLNRKSNTLSVPYNTRDAQKMRNELNEKISEYEENDEEYYAQDDTLGGIYFATITTYKKSELGDYNIPIYDDYYYDIKEKSQVKRSDVIRALGLDSKEIKKKITAYFKGLYLDEIEAEYVDENECNFDECYLHFYRDIRSLDDYVLTVEDGKLYAYISFDINSMVDDKEFFDKLNYDYYKIQINY